MTPARNLSHLSRDTGYRWADRDPVLEFITKDITDSGWPLSYLAERSGVSVSTLSNWQKGKVKHPANFTVRSRAYSPRLDSQNRPRTNLMPHRNPQVMSRLRDKVYSPR